MPLDVSIVGATGYTGQKLVDILLRHPQARLKGLFSTTDEPRPLASFNPRFAGRSDLTVRKYSLKEAASADVVFLALPHTTAMDCVPKLLKAGIPVIDLSADYRLRDAQVYEQAYGLKHKDPGHIAKAVYGLPELYRAKIKNAQLVANPGCYPTAAILALAPLLASDDYTVESVIIDAKSGASGAGKKAVSEMIFNEVDEDFKAYKVNTHQHKPEISQELSRLNGKKINPVFVPHLLPLQVGILETIYVKLASRTKTEQLLELYRSFYREQPFVRVRPQGSFPRLKDVVESNFCDIGLQADGDSLIIISAIDNLVKGASGQAVQNMNIMFNYPETQGLL